MYYYSTDLWDAHINLYMHVSACTYVFTYQELRYMNAKEGPAVA